MFFSLEMFCRSLHNLHNITCLVFAFVFAHKDKHKVTVITDKQTKHGNLSISVVGLSKTGVNARGLFFLCHSLGLTALFYQFDV